MYSTTVMFNLLPVNVYQIKGVPWFGFEAITEVLKIEEPLEQLIEEISDFKNLVISGDGISVSVITIIPYTEVLKLLKNQSNVDKHNIKLWLERVKNRTYEEETLIELNQLGEENLIKEVLSLRQENKELKSKCEDHFTFIEHLKRNYLADSRKNKEQL
ncbi:hypothetical protein [Pleionea sp. CnH1-48]|uniref:hypothetical protein n=1 Tax=Pleionea sp. CnH1-48 TaxID=2954494 RepID=UPI00209783F1|nr:hypothetical protein [Pleionea sp. CnH1-48]MCO7227604.1 hypothetical protein [Pleionea sp. CnH1-48]